MNRQTERINQTLETYLQYYVNHSQRNWIQLLSMAQLVLNNVKIIIIGVSAFYINYGRHPNLFNTSKKSLQIIKILKNVKQLKQIYNKILKNIKYN